jgi:hypothetical protein
MQVSREKKHIHQGNRHKNNHDDTEGRPSRIQHTIACVSRWQDTCETLFHEYYIQQSGTTEISRVRCFYIFIATTTRVQNIRDPRRSNEDSSHANSILKITTLKQNGTSKPHTI